MISVAGNEIPRLMSAMVAAALSDDWDGAREIHNRVLPLMAGNFIELVKDVFKKIEFPLPVKEVRLAKDPLNATAKGALEDGDDGAGSDRGA